MADGCREHVKNAVFRMQNEELFCSSQLHDSAYFILNSIYLLHVDFIHSSFGSQLGISECTGFESDKAI